MKSIYKRIAYLIRQSSQRFLSAAEQFELNSWLQDPINRELFKQLSDPENEVKEIMRLQHYDSGKAFRTFRTKTSTRMHRLRIYARWAACFILPIAIGIYFWTTQPEEKLETRALATTPLLPGEKKAILTLSGGEKIELGGQADRQTIQEGGTEICIDSSMMKYTFSEAMEENKTNAIYVPRRGEYSMMLADGTRVYLNADTRLTYPVTFGKDSREVLLEGEAFFEVAHDANRPFVVRSGELRVTVLGTKFNLKTYSDEKDIVTTLVEGKVMVNTGKGKVVMKPGEQVSYSLASGEMTKRNVDVTLYASWKDGLFKFQRESLENILTTLSRWYDVTIFYENASAKELLFTGDLKRYTSIDEHLKMLEMTTNVHFMINKNAVFVQ